MKTQEELNALKAECESLGRKLSELTEDELHQVTGGVFDEFEWKMPKEPGPYNIHIYSLKDKNK